MVKNLQQSAYHKAVELSTKFGFACIPLQADAKRPLAQFDLSRSFKQRLSDRELRQWFAAPPDAQPNIGVICGSISHNLFVFDFDHPDHYHFFCGMFPAFSLSYTVRTRRGYHLYLRSTPTSLKSARLPGIDLKARGGYVVGAGSVVKGYTYTVAVDAPVMLVDESTISAMLRLFSGTPLDEETTMQRQEHRVNTSALIHHYVTHVPLNGRNNALYRTALHAAYKGIAQQTCFDALATLHAHTPPIAEHPPETTEQRLEEARNTIASAYKAQPKPSTETHPYGKGNSIGIPNAIRESLLKRRQTLTARLLDAFALANWKGSKVITMQEAVLCAKEYRIGRSSVIKILNNSAIFTKREITQSPPVGDSDKPIPNCKSRRGKPTAYEFIIPTHAELAAACAVTLDGTTDKLTAADLRSNKAYRMALHRELLRRQSPELSNEYLARRLGASKRSIQRYNSALQVISTPVFGYEPLTWSNVHTAAFWDKVRVNQAYHDITPGRWLQVKDGKRYPAIKGIALKLLARRQTPLYCQRLPNHLQLPSEAQQNTDSTVKWRHLSALAPDWLGDAHAYPPLHITIEPLAAPPPKPPPEPPRPDDLTVIKGIGRRWARVLSRAGYDTFEKLGAVTDMGALADLIPSVYVGWRQVSYWVYQAALLARGELTPEDLKAWRYSDWKDFQYELMRITPGASEHFKRKLAEEFVELGWLKYKPVLPVWFLALMAEVR